MKDEPENKQKRTNEHEKQLNTHDKAQHSESDNWNFRIEDLSGPLRLEVSEVKLSSQGYPNERRTRKQAKANKRARKTTKHPRQGTALRQG